MPVEPVAPVRQLNLLGRSRQAEPTEPRRRGSSDRRWSFPARWHEWRRRSAFIRDYIEGLVIGRVGIRGGGIEALARRAGSASDARGTVETIRTVYPAWTLRTGGTVGPGAPFVPFVPFMPLGP